MAQISNRCIAVFSDTVWDQNVEGGRNNRNVQNPKGTTDWAGGYLSTHLEMHVTAILWQTSCRLWHWVAVTVTSRTFILSHLLLSYIYHFVPLPFLSFMSFIYVFISLLLSFLCYFLVICSVFNFSYFLILLFFFSGVGLKSPGTAATSGLLYSPKW
jgi:hypothetical protein